MSVLLYIRNVILVNVLSLVYGLFTLLCFLVTYLKNPFSDPWAQKLRLEYPKNLTDLKYGVHQYVKVNNIKLHYMESGDPSKPLMIFLHGFPEFWYTWRHQIVEFNKDFWCIAVDMRGYGDSEKPEHVSDYKLDTLVEDIRDLVRKLEKDKCILISHDWGSSVAIRFRDLYPDALNALVTLGGTSIEAYTNLMYDFTDLDQFRKGWYVLLLRLPWIPELYFEMNNMKWFEMAHDKDTVTAQDIECYKYWFGKPTAFTPPINYYRANMSYVPLKKPRCELPVPFLAAIGERDIYVSLKNLDILKQLYSTIETSIVKDCSHFLNEEEPQVFNKLIKDFLSKHKL